MLDVQSDAESVVYNPVRLPLGFLDPLPPPSWSDVRRLEEHLEEMRDRGRQIYKDRQATGFRLAEAEARMRVRDAQTADAKRRAAAAEQRAVAAEQRALTVEAQVSERLSKLVIVTDLLMEYRDPMNIV